MAASTSAVDMAAGVLTGRCNCGRVRYAADTASRDGSWCHCRMCQRASGNVALSLLNVPRDCMRWDGEPDRYRSSPLADRLFCSRCGTHLGFAYIDGKTMDLTVGSLDHPELVRCTTHFGIESRHDSWWAPGLPEHRADENAELADMWRAAGIDPDSVNNQNKFTK